MNKIGGVGPDYLYCPVGIELQLGRCYVVSTAGQPLQRMSAAYQVRRRVWTSGRTG